MNIRTFSVVVLLNLFERFNIPFETFKCPSTLSLFPSSEIFVSSPFTSSVASSSTVILAFDSMFPLVTEYLLPFLIENFPPEVLTSELFSEELFISSSPVLTMFTVPPVILLSEVFNVNFESLLILVIPPVWLNLLVEDVVLFAPVFRLSVP